MDEFPTGFCPDQQASFCKENYDAKLRKFRKKIYNHVISSKEEEFFDMDAFCKKYLGNDKKLMSRLQIIVIKELESRGWTCTTSFGGTGLFIYAKDRPTNCFPDGF